MKIIRKQIFIDPPILVRLFCFIGFHYELETKEINSNDFVRISKLKTDFKFEKISGRISLGHNIKYCAVCGKEWI